MEIQKIFSDEYNEERLYSILMNEEEYDLLQSMYSKSDDKAIIGAGAAAGLAGAGLYGVGIHKNRKFKNDLLKVLEKNNAASFEASLKENEAVSKFLEDRGAIKNLRSAARSGKLDKTVDKLIEKAGKNPNEGKILSETFAKHSGIGKNLRRAGIAAGLAGAGLAGYGLYRSKKNNN